MQPRCYTQHTSSSFSSLGIMKRIKEPKGSCNENKTDFASVQKVHARLCDIETAVRHNSFFFMLCSVTSPFRQLGALLWFVCYSFHRKPVCPMRSCPVQSLLHTSLVLVFLFVCFFVCFFFCFLFCFVLMNDRQFLDFAKAFFQDTVAVYKFFFYCFPSDLLRNLLYTFFASYRGQCFLYDKSDQIEACPGWVVGNNTGKCAGPCWGEGVEVPAKERCEMLGNRVHQTFLLRRLKK